MVISGFLMIHVSLARVSVEHPGTWVATGDVWIRRFFRIAPLYYLALTLAFALAPMLREGGSTLQSVNPER